MNHYNFVGKAIGKTILFYKTSKYQVYLGKNGDGDQQLSLETQI
jgi:hypothetical protein